MSETYTPIITEQGLNAALAAETGGFTVDITHVSVGSSGYVPPVNEFGRATQTALFAEQARVEIQDARDVGNGQTDLSCVIDGEDGFTIKEVGFHLADGTLFAVASSTTPLIVKLASGKALLGLELVLDAVDPSSVTVVSTGPPLQLLMTRELAVMTALNARVALETMRLGDRIKQMDGAY